MKHVFSKLGVMPLIIVFCSCIISCSSQNNDPTPLSESKVAKLVDSFIKDKQLTPAYADFTVGRFRCDKKESREVYRKLEAAGVITLKIDTTYVTKKVKTSHDYWTGRDYYENKTKTLYTLTVALTDATKEYVLDEAPSKKAIDPDMEQPKIGDFPEFHIDEVVYDIPDIKEGEAASKTIYTKGTEISVFKVRNIRINQNRKDQAWFECILQNGRVTPAYRVKSETYDNEKTLLYGVLQYYVDKGWTIVDISDEPIKLI